MARIAETALLAAWQPPAISPSFTSDLFASLRGTMGKSSSNLDWDPLGNLGLPTVVLYGDTGHGLHGLGSQNGNGPPNGGGSGGSPPVINTAGAGLTINISWDASVANAPTAFTTVVNNVVQYLQSQFSDPVTINIAIGYGEVGGSNLPGGALGASSTYLAGYGYSTIKNALAADAKTTADASAVASLPASDPTGGNWWVTTAEAKAIGLMGASSSIDGNIGFTSAGLFDYDNTDGVGAGLYDFYGVVEHEISEVMGRILLTSGRIGFYFNSNDVYDLFHYSSTGTHTFSASTPGYFSVDNGVTHINTFNTVSGGDAGDWKGDTVDADNAFATPGVKLPVTTGDLTTLDAIGWDAGPAPVLPDLTVSNFALDFSTGKASFQVNNIGTASAGASTAGLYLSSDSTITTSDTLLGNPAASTPPIGAGAAASDSPESILFSLTAPATAGTYYLGVVTDTSNAITESNEGNNASNALPVILGTDLAN